MSDRYCASKFMRLSSFDMLFSTSHFTPYILRTPEQRDVIMSAFKNEAYKLLRRSKSASVLEYAYNNYASALQRERIVRKLYGNMYQLCKVSS